MIYESPCRKCNIDNCCNPKKCTPFIEWFVPEWDAACELIKKHIKTPAPERSEENA